MLLLSEATLSSVQLIEFAALAMEVLAILVIVAGIVYGGARFAIALLRRGHAPSAYRDFKSFMGRTLLLGLEILVAADVVRTVALEPTMQNVATLGVLVLIRTFLSWSVIVEIEGRWPWQQAPGGPDQERQPKPAAPPGTEARAG